jgi:hypothetical protein
MGQENQFDRDQRTLYPRNSSSYASQAKGKIEYLSMYNLLSKPFSVDIYTWQILD